MDADAALLSLVSLFSGAALALISHSISSRLQLNRDLKNRLIDEAAQASQALVNVKLTFTEWGEDYLALEGPEDSSYLLRKWERVEAMRGHLENLEEHLAVMELCSAPRLDSTLEEVGKSARVYLYTMSCVGTSNRQFLQECQQLENLRTLLLHEVRHSIRNEKRLRYGLALRYRKSRAAAGEFIHKVKCRFKRS